MPGNSVDDVVTARVNYAQLDRGTSPVRLRLNSIATRAHGFGHRAVMELLRGWRNGRLVL